MNRTLTAAVAAAFAAGVAPATAQQPSGEAEPRPGAQAPQQEQPSAVARAGDGAAQGFGVPATALDVERSSEYGQHIVDGRGQPIYVLESESSGESDCYDACALAWPPVLAPEGGEQVETQHRALDENQLGMTERRDGKMQLTYNNYPLYYYAMDPGDGEVTGHDVTDEWGEWYLLTPEGEPLHTEEHGEEGGGEREQRGRG
ncbi:MAG: hypothetical protein JXB36_18515 [Gammaproteobacteria bacterium]|nr:hypothetical protein [Gammaproteobacteria bacterium]